MSQDHGLPLVSIVIPVFNGSDYVREAIDSALAQTWPSVEVIVVNDGSTDDTEAICLNYGDRIRYFHKKNGGQSSALNYGINQMKGLYFSWLSHDDLYLPGKVERQVNAASGKEDIIIYSDWMSVNAAGEPISLTQIRDADVSGFRYRLITKNPYHGCSMLVPAVAFRELGLFDTSIPLTSDVDLWFRFAGKYPFIHVPEVLVKGRVHSGQVSVKKYRAHQRESDRFYTRCLKELSDPEIMDGSGEADLRRALAILARNFARREYFRASTAVLRRLRKAGISPLSLMAEKVRCRILYQKKHWKNRLKYGWLKGRFS